MAQSSWPYDGDSVQETEWMAMSRLWRRSGVIDDADNELAVSAVAGELEVSVATGEAWLDGFYFSSDAAETLTLESADLNDDRIDLVVVRSDRSAGTATLQVITGTPAGSPTAPTVTQDHEGSDVYEIALAEVLVEAAASNVDGNVTDVRTLVDRNASKRELDNATTRAVETFAASGTFDKGDYPWARYVKVRAIGAGGGGGGVSASNVQGASGGGAGAAAESLLDVDSLASSETVTVGAGGAGGSDSDSTALDGGASSFGTHVQAGGGSGASINGNVGHGATTATGDTTYAGGDGASGAHRFDGALLPGGTGGASLAGGGGGGARLRTSSGSDGRDGQAPGSGAGGASNDNTGTARTGGDGADGIVIVEVYG